MTAAPQERRGREGLRTRLRTSVVGCLVIFATLTAGAVSAQGAIVFDGTPGTDAPPARLGPYTTTAFGADPQPLFTDVTGVASPLGGAVQFSPGLAHFQVGNGWASWSHNYAGDVYFSNGGTSVTIGLPAGTTAFYFYAEPNPFDVFTITATAQDGTTSGPVEVSGAAGARYFGFYVTGGSTLASITVEGTVDFAIGEFGIASGPTSADQCKKGGWRNFGIFKNQGDCVSFVRTNGRNGPAGGGTGRGGGH
jgi:hypothetical protein